MEAACDQAVIRPLGREDTARYAATLLHLGCRSGFPAAVPLAFGTEDTKGRIRAVLSYRRPALWLILATAAACLAAGLFLLGDTNGRLEGRPVDEGMVFSYGETLPLPERTPESFSRARKTTGKFFAGTTLSWSIRLPPAEKTGNPNRTV